jgi:hypothetical protein
VPHGAFTLPVRLTMIVEILGCPLTTPETLTLKG